jgi:hypothetical protein
LIWKQRSDAEEQDFHAHEQALADSGLVWSLLCAGARGYAHGVDE